MDAFPLVADHSLLQLIEGNPGGFHLEEPLLPLGLEVVKQGECASGFLYRTSKAVPLDSTACHQREHRGSLSRTDKRVGIEHTFGV